MLPGGRKEIRIRLDRFEGVLDGELALTNARVRLEHETCDPAEQTVSHTATIDATPMLQAHKTTDRVAILSGEQIEYTLHILNQGDGSAEDTYVVDRIPTDTDIVQVSTSGTSRT